MTSHIDLPLLARLVQAKRGKRGLKDLAGELPEVSASTIARIEAQRVGDMNSSTFLRLCDWLEVHPADLIVGDHRYALAAVKGIAAVELEVRRSKVLSPRSAHVLAAIIRAAYDEDQRWGGGSDGS